MTREFPVATQLYDGEMGEEKSEITMSLAFWQLWFSQKKRRAFDDTFKPLKALAVEQ